MDPKLFERYSRQILFQPLGEAGQQKLRQSSVVLAGCGALGTMAANLLVRSGIGRLRIIDRDFVEFSNLQRQTLFEESDARDALPKAVAAEKRLRAINSDVEIEGIVADLNAGNAEELLSGFPLILDGTDNFETRLLINDFAVSENVPWIYAGAVASYGVTLAILPGITPCLACLIGGGSDSGAGLEETCDTAGILNSAASLIASLEASEALKILSGNSNAISGRLLACDVWAGRLQSVGVARDPECRACAHRAFVYLNGKAQPHITMCGRNSVQIHERNRRIDLAALGVRLKCAISETAGAGVQQNEFLLRFLLPPYEMTVFSDGRAVIKGTQDPAVARTLYAKYVGA